MCPLKREINICTLLEEDSISPLFSGTEWAGTRVWNSALEGVNYLVDKEIFDKVRKTKRRSSGGLTTREDFGVNVIELGAGLAVPGLTAGVMNEEYEKLHPQAKDWCVVVSDMETITKQMEGNVKSNFGEGAKVIAKTLDWSVAGLNELIGSIPDEVKSLQINGEIIFDVILSTDCVYAPLYGKSYIPLSETIIHMMTINPNAISVNVVERRNQDEVEIFVDLMEKSGVVWKSETVSIDKYSFEKSKEMEGEEGLMNMNENWANEDGEGTGIIEIFVFWGNGWKK